MALIRFLPAVQKQTGLVLLILLLMSSSAGVTWQVQDWWMDKKLAGQYQ